MENAEKEARISKHKGLHPVHLLIACFNETEGALGEIVLKCSVNQDSLRALLNDINNLQYPQLNSEFFNLPVTEEVELVMDAAIRYMEGYNQVFLNEGHLLKAMIKTKVVERLLSSEDQETIINLGTVPRDMIAHLGKYTFPNKAELHHVRRAVKKDEYQLLRFVEDNFSEEWSRTIKGAFDQKEQPVYIAFDDDGNIIGFAAYDTYQNKKCYFGPMGVTKSNRVKGIGYALLHYCLRDMHQIGYEYAIIGGAGPIEFYEKACNAVVIPSIAN
ncbi:MAG: GNAT family N-acetyltransferase [Bacillaceae bacterium]|nr:GNAT family N-acetyltransferase [Bacillaceae bacterium]